MARMEEQEVHGADSVIVTLVVIYAAMLFAYFGWWAPQHPVEQPNKADERPAKPYSPS